MRTLRLYHRSDGWWWNLEGVAVMSLKKHIASVAVAALLASAGFTLALAPASAVGGNCSAIKQKQEVSWDLDRHRVRAFCSSLQGDSKARGTLVRNGGPDVHTSWFTTKNKYYYSAWGNCYAGCSTRVQIEHV
jgi:hypothetical protein